MGGWGGTGNTFLYLRLQKGKGALWAGKTQEGTGPADQPHSARFEGLLNHRLAIIHLCSRSFRSDVLSLRRGRHGAGGWACKRLSVKQLPSPTAADDREHRCLDGVIIIS